jgi:hypothetical protein
MSIFDGSRFGEVAGSLLARRRKVSSRDRNEALVLSALLSGFTGKQQSLQENLTNNLTDLQDQYQDIFQTNRDIYNSQENIKARAEFKQYQADKEAYLNTKSIEFFNQDPNMQLALGTNPYNTLAGTRDLNEDSKQLFMDTLNDKRKLAEEFILAKSKSPVVTMPTFSQYNDAAKAEYLAARNQLRDDPTKKSVLANMFDGIFGTGSSKKIELEGALEESRLTREAQDNLVAENDTIVGDVMARNRAVLKGKSTALTGLEMFDAFTTTTQDLKDKQNEIQNYFRDSSNPITEEKLIDAYANGVKIDRFPGLSTLQEADIEGFANTFTYVQQLKKRGVDDPTDYLTVRQRDIHDSVYGVSREEITNISDQVKDDDKRFNISSQIQMMIAKDNNLSDALKFISGDFKFSDDGTEDASSFQSHIFITNVIKSSVKYQNKYDLDEAEALKQAIQDQIAGIIPESSEEYENKSGLIGFGLLSDVWSTGRYASTVQYVNPDVVNLPILPETADTYVSNLNENEWQQINTGYKDENGDNQNFIPREGKEYIQRDEEQGYELTFATKPVVNNQEEIISYKWYLADEKTF